jgi:hypothetical protein
VELVAEGDIAAAASRVDMRSVQRASSDEGLLSDLVRRHDGVVAELSAWDVVAPLRFGTACASLEEVRLLLADGRDRFRAVLEFLRGRDEFGVQVILAAPIPPAEPRMEEIADRPGGGTTYLKEKAQARRETEERSLAARHAADETHELLGGLAVASRPIAAARAHPGVVSNVSYLIERTSAERFRGLVADLDARYRPRGIQVRLTGPWPPYSFSDVETTRAGARENA